MKLAQPTENQIKEADFVQSSLFDKLTVAKLDIGSYLYSNGEKYLLISNAEQTPITVIYRALTHFFGLDA